LSESGSWILLRSTQYVTDRMTGTELLRYIFQAAAELCPEEGRPGQITVRLEVTE